MTNAINSAMSANKTTAAATITPIFHDSNGKSLVLSMKSMFDALSMRLISTVPVDVVVAPVVKGDFEPVSVSMSMIVTPGDVVE